MLCTPEKPLYSLISVQVAASRGVPLPAGDHRVRAIRPPRPAALHLLQRRQGALRQLQQCQIRRTGDKTVEAHLECFVTLKPSVAGLETLEGRVEGERVRHVQRLGGQGPVLAGQVSPVRE